MAYDPFEFTFDISIKAEEFGIDVTVIEPDSYIQLTIVSGAIRFPLFLTSDEALKLSCALGDAVQAVKEESLKTHTE